MSVASEIERIKGNIASAYSSAGAKGATMPDVQNSANLAGCIDTITGGGGEPVNKSKYGVTIDNMLGAIGEDGSLLTTKEPFVFDGTGIKRLQYSNILTYKFFNSGCTAVYLPDITELSGIELCMYAFASCGITTVDISNLRTISKADCCSYMFYNNKITVVDLHNLTTIDNASCTNMFANNDIREVRLDNLATISYNLGCRAMFANNKNLQTISFPMLTSVNKGAFGSTSASSQTFYGCTGLTEIHFRADMQATIEATTGYSNKWGATNASIIFDL